MSAIYIFNGGDMRLVDNLAFIRCLEYARQNDTIPHVVYVADSWHWPKSIHAQKFIRDAISDIVVRITVVNAIDKLNLKKGAAVFMNRMVYKPQVDAGKPDFHPYAAAIKRAGGSLQLLDDWTCMKTEVRNKPYLVFTPFYERAKTIIRAPYSEFRSENTPMRLRAFALLSARGYDHDIGSMISPYISRGIISIREAAQKAAHNSELLRQVLWREFYYQIAMNDPQKMALPPRAYSVNLATVKRAALRAWTNGKTGVDYIDYAMLLLRAQGIMPNRLRMLCAEALTSSHYYAVPWWFGETHFELYLQDYDFVLNRGNWLWVADSNRAWSKPSFRYFNLERQSKHRAVKAFMAAVKKA